LLNILHDYILNYTRAYTVIRFELYRYKVTVAICKFQWPVQTNTSVAAISCFLV